MSEAKWWPKGTVPTEDGFYFSCFGGDFSRNATWRFPSERHSTHLKSPDQKTRQFYGPIPEPPKEPPKLRPFTAKHKRHGAVSGILIPEKNIGSSMKHQIFFWADGKTQYFFVEEDQLSDIQWLDKE